MLHHAFGPCMCTPTREVNRTARPANSLAATSRSQASHSPVLWLTSSNVGVPRSFSTPFACFSTPCMGMAVQAATNKKNQQETNQRARRGQPLVTKASHMGVVDLAAGLAFMQLIRLMVPKTNA